LATTSTTATSTATAEHARIAMVDAVDGRAASLDPTSSPRANTLKISPSLANELPPPEAPHATASRLSTMEGTR
jgi:hypothetical protein